VGSKESYILMATLGRAFIWRGATALRPALATAVISLLLLTAPPVARAIPQASFTYSPEAPFTNEVVTFTSTSTGVVEPQRWGFDIDRNCNDAMGPTVQRAFATAGVYTVTLCGSDGTGKENYAVYPITVRNRPPVAVFTVAPSSPLSGDTVVLTSISADSDGPITSQAWDLDGDGGFDDAQGPTASVTFPAAGTFPVRLMVGDRDGAVNVAARAISVRERPPDAITPFPVVSMVAKIGVRGTQVEQLLVKAPPGARVRIRCRGRGCPFHTLSRIASSSRASARVEALAARIIRIRRFGRHTLRPGTIVQIWVTKRGEIGKYTRFLIRKAKPPSRVDRCVVPGKKRPVRCTG
jgi:PKD domain-containing protein